MAEQITELIRMLQILALELQALKVTIITLGGVWLIVSLFKRRGK